MARGSKLWHFASGGIPAEFTQLTSGDGALAVSDHGVLGSVTASGGGNDAMALALPFDRSLAKYQRVAQLISLGASVTAIRPNFRLVFQASGPTVDTTANLNTATLVRFTNVQITNWFGQAVYLNTSQVQQRWDDATKAWSASNLASTPQLTRLDDYVLQVIDWDDANSRVRLAWLHAATGSSFTGAHPCFKLVCLTDWLSLANVNNGSQSSGLWLMFGWPDLQALGTTESYHLEWIAHEWSDQLEDCWLDAKNVGANDYQIKHWESPTGQLWLPEVRSGFAIAKQATTWKDAFARWGGMAGPDPADGKLWAVYTGQNASSVNAIGSAENTGPQGAWTDFGSNPVITREVGTHREILGQCAPIIDMTDPDPARRYKVIVMAQASPIDGKYRAYLYVGASRTGTFSLDNALGAGGLLLDWDTNESDLGVQVYAPPFYLNGQWILPYVAINSATAWKSHVARGLSLAAGALTRDTSLHLLDPADGVEGSLTTGSSTSRTVDLGSTTGFVRDMPVMYDRDVTADNWRTSRVRKVVSGTQIELYSLMPGMTSTGKLRSWNAGKQYPGFVRPRGDAWEWFCTCFAVFYLESNGWGGNMESMAVATAQNADREKPVFDWWRSPGGVLAEGDATSSSENPKLINPPVYPYQARRSTRERRRRAAYVTR